MDLRLVTRGALAYAGVVAVEWAGIVASFQTLAIIPVYVLTGIGIVATVHGLEIEGKSDFKGGGVLMIAGFGLGVLGVWGLLVSAIQHDHTVDVCAYSKIRPLDPQAQWACPQVQASYWILWPLAISLLIPAVLFLLVPFLTLRQEDKLHRMDEAEKQVDTAERKNAADVDQPGQRPEEP